MALKKIILSLIVTVAFCIVACSTFIRFEMDDNYFQLLPMSIGVVVVAIVAVFSCFLRKGNQGFRFIFSDFLFVVIVAYYAARYDYELQLANWKIIYAALLLLLWFAARIILSNLSISRSILLGGFVCIGCVLAIWGILQLYGFEKSNHNLFPITGPFYNPGPYSGYIAMLFPIGFNQLLSSQGKIRYLWLFALSIIIIILPAGMSRSAWLALLVSCIWLLFIHKNWIYKIKLYTCSHRRKVVLLSMLTITLVIAFSFFLFQMKEDSANGRLFIWKNTCKAIQAQPFWGYGPGSFPMIYGREQIAHFASGNYSSMEAHVAGSPEYAFNECLQACLEGGVFLSLLMAVLYIRCLHKGILNKEYGSCSALLALFVFSLSSYPLQILSFGIMGVLLLTICVRDEDLVHIKTPQKSINFLAVFVLSISVISFFYLCHVKEIAKKWSLSNILQKNGAFYEASIGYEIFYEEMKYNVSYLLKYAQVLSAQEKYNEACEVLERAKLVSCDAKIWNMQGKYYQFNGNYAMAEICFEESLKLLPNRLYPYYLLAKLYVQPKYFYPDKAKFMIEVVLTKSPKIHSQAIDEMRMEMNILKQEISYY